MKDRESPSGPQETPEQHARDTAELVSTSLRSPAEAVRHRSLGEGFVLRLPRNATLELYAGVVRLTVDLPVSAPTISDEGVVWERDSDEASFLAVSPSGALTMWGSRDETDTRVR